MAVRRWIAAAAALLAATAPVIAQPAKPVPPKNALEERFKTSRLVAPEDSVSQKFNLMRAGRVALSPPSADDLKVLETTARQTVYPVTHFELYSASDSTTAELTPRPDEKTVGRQLNELRGQLVIVEPGKGPLIPDTQVDYARHYAEAVVKSIDEVLAKSSLPVVRANAVRLLEVLAESGAPAATARIIKLLEAKTPTVETLYYGLKAAENAIAMYDPARPNWVSKDQYFALVRLVDDAVRQVPPVVAEMTYQPVGTGGGGGVLATDPKAPPPPPAALTTEQVATVQMFRLQAVRALARVKTDTVADAKGENSRRPLFTLARVAVSDPAVVPPPSYKEVGEAVIGLVTAVPGADVDGAVLTAAVARGLTDFVNDKVADNQVIEEGKVQSTHWKVYGARMKAAFQGWEANVKTKAKMANKEGVGDLVQLSVSGVFDPLTKQDDKGIAPGLTNAEVRDWFQKKSATLKTGQLYITDKDTKLTFGR